MLKDMGYAGMPHRLVGAANIYVSNKTGDRRNRPFNNNKFKSVIERKLSNFLFEFVKGLCFGIESGCKKQQGHTDNMEGVFTLHTSPDLG